jgi:hypothetical protein
MPCNELLSCLVSHNGTQWSDKKSVIRVECFYTCACTKSGDIEYKHSIFSFERAPVNVNTFAVDNQISIGLLRYSYYIS